jgi:hypothetical protein
MGPAELPAQETSTAAASECTAPILAAVSFTGGTGGAASVGRLRANRLAGGPQPLSRATAGPQGVSAGHLCARPAAGWTAPAPLSAPAGRCGGAGVACVPHCWHSQTSLPTCRKGLLVWGSRVWGSSQRAGRVWAQSPRRAASATPPLQASALRLPHAVLDVAPSPTFLEAYRAAMTGLAAERGVRAQVTGCGRRPPQHWAGASRRPSLPATSRHQ